MRYPGDPFAGLPEGVAPPEGLETASVEHADAPRTAATETTLLAPSELAPSTCSQIEFSQSAFDRWGPRTALAVLAACAIAWIGCTGYLMILVHRSQRTINRAVTSLEADGFQVTREHVDVLVANGPGKLSAESARAMCRADFIYTYKIRQNGEPGPLPAEFAAVFEVADVPPYREYKKRQNWPQLLSESP